MADSKKHHVYELDYGDDQYYVGVTAEKDWQRGARRRATTTFGELPQAIHRISTHASDAAAERVKLVRIHTRRSIGSEVYNKRLYADTLLADPAESVYI